MASKVKTDRMTGLSGETASDKNLLGLRVGSRPGQSSPADAAGLFRNISWGELAQRRITVISRPQTAAWHRDSVGGVLADTRLAISVRTHKGIRPVRSNASIEST
jgi:hypothetical protein